MVRALPILAACTALACASAAVRARDTRSAIPVRAQTGLASYYGPGFDGQRTASGELFDQDAMTAAHRTLPFGTIVRVTNLENGRRVKLRVTDRGPYGPNRAKGCIIDVSTAAARRLGFLKDGIARVRVQVLRRGGG